MQVSLGPRVRVVFGVGISQQPFPINPYGTSYHSPGHGAWVSGAQGWGQPSRAMNYNMFWVWNG